MRAVIRGKLRGMKVSAMHQAETTSLHRMKWLILLGALMLSVACANRPSPDGAAGLTSEPASDRTAPKAAYRLGSGDQLRVIVFGEEDLSGEFEVDDMGVVSLPLVGQVRADGRTLRSFEEAVRVRLREGYLKDPRVSVQVLNYRPFYIIGEVALPGEYPFVSGMNVLNAVALSGGFTSRANTTKVFITRDGNEKEYLVTTLTGLQPGDMIRIPERYF
jgi:protein involved in polysaccharide export with SLBB domain